MEIPVQMFRHSSGTHDQTGGRNHAKTSAAVKSNKKIKMRQNMQQNRESRFGALSTSLPGFRIFKN
jgi:hypothetical protein